MERMVKLYAAPTEYMALSVREALAQAGIPCLVFCNELPMEPGFTFGADTAYADVFVAPEHAQQAYRIARDVRETLCATDHGAEVVFPRRINLRFAAGIPQALLLCWSLILLPLFATGRPAGPGQAAHSSAYATVLSTPLFIFVACLYLFLFGMLLIANWDLTRRTALTAGSALLGVLVLPLWLVYELAGWCGRKLVAIRDGWQRHSGG